MKPGAKQTVGELTGSAVVLACFTGIVSTAVIYDALPPILPALSASFGGGRRGDLIAQLAATIPIFGMALSGLVSGVAIERFGIKTVLSMALIVFALAGSAGILLASATPLLASRMLTGIGAGTMMTCGTSLIAANFAGLARSRMTGYLFAVGAACSMACVFTSGLMAQTTWRLPFLLHGVVAVLFGWAVFRLPNQGRYTSRRDSGVQDFLREFGLIRAAVPAYLLIFVLIMLGNLLTIQIALLMATKGTTSPTTIAKVCMSHAFAALVANLCVGRIQGRYGTVRTLQLALSLVATGCLLCGLASTPALLAGAVFVAGLGIGTGIPATLNLIMRSVPQSLVPRALGFGTTMMYLGGSSSPLLIVPLSARVGVQGEYYLAGGVILAGVVCSFINEFRMGSYSS